MQSVIRALRGGGNPSSDQPSLPSHYGPPRVVPIHENGGHFVWMLVDELYAEFPENPKGDGFYRNRTSLFEAYMDGLLFGVEVEETDQMYEQQSRMDDIFMKDRGTYSGRNLLPCFCIRDNEDGKVASTWTGERARDMGLETLMLNAPKQADAGKGESTSPMQIVIRSPRGGGDSASLQPALPGHFGPLRVVPINRHTAESGVAAFFLLLDELREEVSENFGFYHNRESLLEAYAEGLLFGVEVNQTDDICTKDQGGGVGRYLLPCFCIRDKEEGTVAFVWTGERARGKGLATFMLDALDISRAEKPLDSAKGFWEKYFARRAGYEPPARLLTSVVLILPVLFQASGVLILPGLVTVLVKNAPD